MRPIMMHFTMLTVWMVFRGLANFHLVLFLFVYFLPTYQSTCDVAGLLTKHYLKMVEMNSEGILLK